MDKEILKYKNSATIIATILSFIAIFPIETYGYYIFLRWVLTFTAGFLAWISYNLKKSFWLFLMAIIAILFNPFVPITLNKETWVPINFIVALIFLFSLFLIKQKKA